MKQNKLVKPLTKKTTRLVYSSEGDHLNLCKKCWEKPCECADSPSKIIPILPAKITLKIRLEKNQRGGKTVTVIFNIPFNPDYFFDLTKKLKNYCGTGGSFKKEEMQIEIQGDHRLKIEDYLKKIGFNIKQAGG